MAKITTGYKRTGDLMTAQMYNELVDAVNDNDADITDVKEQIEDITTHARSQPSRGIYLYGTNLDSTIRDAVDGDWCVVLGSGNTFPGTIYTYNGSTWNSGGSWSPNGTVDLADYPTKAEMEASIEEHAIETADNLTTETTGKALDARQGFVLAGQISQMQAQNSPKTSTGVAGTDLDISDEQGNILVRFSAGGIKTKNFDSAQDCPTRSANFERTDLDISDEQGNILVRFAGGHVKTKNFDSKYLVGLNWLQGKKVAIIGDSISTNGNSGIDANMPEIVVGSSDVGVELSAFLTFYDVNSNLSLGGHTFTSAEIGTEVTFTPVSADVGKKIGLPANYNQNSLKTWWEHAAERLDFYPIPVCWSGSSITSHDLLNSYNTGNNAHKMDCSHAWHDSQIRKCGIRVEGTMLRNAPDVIIIYRGTNDFSHACNVRLTGGFFDSVDFSIPETDIIANGIYGYKEGLVMTISKLRNTYPFAKIYLCTLNNFRRINYEKFPVNNGFATLQQWNNAIREVANYMECGLIDFGKDGITYENCYPRYINDSATTPTHPNEEGHRLMGERAILDLLYN